jgi:hypothetical protein
VCMGQNKPTAKFISTIIYTGGQQANATHAPGIQHQLPSHSYSSGATGLKEDDDDCEMRYSGPIEMTASMHGTTMHNDYSQPGNACSSISLTRYIYKGPRRAL